MVQYQSEKAVRSALWPCGRKSICQCLTGRLVLFLRGVRQVSPLNLHADQASPRTSTQWLSRETYCAARAFSKVRLLLLDLIYPLMIFSFLCPYVTPTSQCDWVRKCVPICVCVRWMGWVGRETYIMAWGLSITPKEGQNRLWLWLCNISSLSCAQACIRWSRKIQSWDATWVEINLAEWLNMTWQQNV